MKKSLLLAGVACSLIATNASAGWKDSMHHAIQNSKYYIGADYAYVNADFNGSFQEAKDSYNSGSINLGVRMDKFGVEIFNQMSGKRTKDLTDGDLKTKINAYGLDLYGYQPLGCEGKYDLLATVGLANYYYKGEWDSGSDSKNRIGYRVGGGAMYNFNDHISARVVGRYAYIGGDSLNHVAEVTAGLRYTF